MKISLEYDGANKLWVANARDKKVHSVGTGATIEAALMNLSYQLACALSDRIV